MKPKHLLLLLLITILLPGCTKEADIRLSEFTTPVITGYYVRNDIGMDLKTIGIPNVRLGDNSNDYHTSTYFFTFFPNPCTDSCLTFVKAPQDNSTRKVWITQANWLEEKNEPVTDPVGMDNMTVGGYPLIQKEFTSDRTMIDLSSLGEGYYRIYLEVDGNLLYDNLIKYKSNK